jgi:dihydroorotase
VKVFIGSSTGALLVEDDESLRRIFQVIRRRAAFHAEDEYRLNERKPPASRAIRARIRCGATRPRR